MKMINEPLLDDDKAMIEHWEWINGEYTLVAVVVVPIKKDDDDSSSSH